MLTISQVAEVANELAQSEDNINSAEEAVAATEETQQQLLQKNNTIKTFYDASNNYINSYFDEKRWINGTIHTKLPYSLVDEGAQLGTSSFFPSNWNNPAPSTFNNVVGSPTSNTTNCEQDHFDLIFQLVDYLINGQDSLVNVELLDDSYSPGDSVITVNGGNQTVGNLIIINDSNTEALVRVESVSGKDLTITEIVPPEQIMLSGAATVTEDISGFSNVDRNSLSGGRILTETAEYIKNLVISWDNDIVNQLTALNSQQDPDRQDQKNAAIADAQNAQSVIAAWQALPDTGVTGDDSKFTDNNLATLTAEINDRDAFRITRLAQISAALGSVGQDEEGIVSGQGLYRDRFERISLQINRADGPLFQYYAADSAKKNQKQQVQNAKQKERAFSSGIHMAMLTENATGTNKIKVESVSNFSVSDRVVITGVGLKNIVADINNINGLEIELSKTIPLIYTTDGKSSMSKAR